MSERLDPNWGERALCKDVLDPDAFFGETASEQNEQKKFCRPCKVKLECLLGALAQGEGEQHGVAGGATSRERNTAINRQGKRFAGNLRLIAAYIFEAQRTSRRVADTWAIDTANKLGLPPVEEDPKDQEDEDSTEPEEQIESDD